MSIEDQTNRGTAPIENAPAAREEDDFVLRSQIKRPLKSDDIPERRMHLRAFDYWHGLSANQQLPQFENLTPEGLTPFKQNCLLLEYHGSGIIVRYCGNELAVLLGGVLAPGTRLYNASPTPFSKALQQRLSTPQGRQEAAEFEFVDEPIECRGTFLPFSARGELAEFIMLVVNHRQSRADDRAEQAATLLEQNETPEQAPESQISEDQAIDNTAALALLAADCAEAGGTVVHPGVGTREGLYIALAQAYRLHIAAARDPAAYKEFLQSHGMRQQKRAPFTPALKLTFGASYDKTRLTEYAAALSCAARHEVGPAELPEFLKNQPGGIKGCVQEERAVRQGKPLKTKKISLEGARAKARNAPSRPLETLSLNQEFGLALVRRNRVGQLELVSTIQTPQNTIDKAIVQIALKTKS